jgi:adenosine 3'-phospho 5'-phosphosulfate transporter B3
MSSSPAQPPPYSLPVLTFSVFFFFGLHNLLQEAIMSLPNSPSGIVLGFLEVLGVTLLTFLERFLSLPPSSRTRRAPLRSVLLLTVLLTSSSSLSNLSLNYINYPTKVVFRSCKLLPTMASATLLNRQTFTGAQ